MTITAGEKMDTQRLDEIEAGLSHVTPGPWCYGAQWLSQRVQPGVWKHIAQVPLNDYDSPRWNADAAHIARLDPDTVRALVSLARDGLKWRGMQARRAAMVAADAFGSDPIPAQIRSATE